MGKSRAAAYALGVQVDEAMQLHSSENDDPPDSQLMGSSKSAGKYISESSLFEYWEFSLFDICVIL